MSNLDKEYSTQAKLRISEETTMCHIAKMILL